MIDDFYYPPILKRRRLTLVDPMELESAKEKFDAVKKKFGREIRVFETFRPSQTSNQIAGAEEESDDFYEFTAEDYYRLMGTKKEDKLLKTKKLRDAEEAARRSRMTKAVIRVRFPDNHTLEVDFHPSETIQGLVDLLKRVVSRTDLPFYLYTTPPKKLMKDLSQDFYSAGLVPGAIVYFSYDFPKGDDASAAASSGPFLQEEIMSLKHIGSMAEQTEPVQTKPEAESAGPSLAPVFSESKPAAEKKPAKPKWFKM